MRMHVFLISATTFLFLATATFSQTYKIKLRVHPKPGQKMQRKDSMVTNMTIRMMGVNGNVQSEQKQTEKRETEFTEIVTKKGKERPLQFQRNYSKATRTGIGGGNRSYHKKTVIFDLKNDKYDVQIQGGGKLTPVDRKQLESSATIEEFGVFCSKVLLPKHAVKVGERWKVDAAKATKIMGAGVQVIDANTSTISGTLHEVYKKGGRRFGVLIYDFKLGMKLPVGRQQNNMGWLKMKVTYNTAIDGSSPEGTIRADGEIDATLNLNPGAAGGVVHIRGDITVRERATLVK